MGSEIYVHHFCHLAIVFGERKVGSSVVSLSLALLKVRLLSL